MHQEPFGGECTAAEIDRVAGAIRSAGLAAAHAVHNGLTAVAETHEMMHGEKVNFGTLTQLLPADHSSAEIDELLAFSTTVGLPTTLSDIGLADGDLETLRTVAAHRSRRRSCYARPVYWEDTCPPRLGDE